MAKKSDSAKIMGVEEKMVELLPQVKLANLNPWSRQLSGIFRGLHLKQKMKILDLACGLGGVSIPLARRYKVNVFGFDILEGYIEKAQGHAKKQGVSKNCKFRVGDIRKELKGKKRYDLVLWIAPPHIWKSSRATIERLRASTKDNGLILVADAYAYNGNSSRIYPEYESLKKMTAGFLSFEDELVRFIDYKSSLWKDDYGRTRKAVRDAMSKVTEPKEKKLFNKYISSLENDERQDSKYLGSAIWVIKKKRG